MCGIVGGVSFNGNFFPTESELRAASDYLKYRGPDDRGELLHDTGSAKISFAHRRLSIIDLSETGHQPMISISGRTIIVFNGEIYNYQSLKNELIGNGFHFKTQSDTEVILNSFECWGIDSTLKKLDGMFAFALFDLINNTLFLARDPFGKKPLYYFFQKNQIAFSSDIRSFNKIGGIEFSLDISAAGYFFSELSTPYQSTIWNEIKKVEPGSYLKFDEHGMLANNEYWQLNYSENCSLSQHEIYEKTGVLLREAVKKRLVADVKVSALLSGGIDSSLVVANMAENSSTRIKTYSVGFKEAPYNELDYARQVAKKFDTDHVELILYPGSLNNIKELILEYGEPFADSSMIPTYLMAKEISKTEKVVLGGDGGDELFAGYDSYDFAHKFDKFKKFSFAHPLSGVLKRLYPSYRIELLDRLLKQKKYPSYTLLDRNMGFSAIELGKLFSNRDFMASVQKEHEKIWMYASPNSCHELINVLAVSTKTRLLNDYLVKVDRATMYSSLEMRSPFLDKNLAEFAATLRPDQLFFKMGPKSILKELARKYFSKEFVNRRKMGFSIPLGTWFRGDLLHDLKDVVLGGKQKRLDMDYQFIEQLIEEHSQGRIDHGHKLWALYVFHIWSNQ
jgi:asparagine synthase (glutamine-hydrolysing)